MVEIYVAKVIETADDIVEEFSDCRRDKIKNKKQGKSRAQSISAGLLLKEVLFRYGMDVKSERIGLHGKPEIEGICFNLSHSEDMVLCAVSKKEVGCDIEKVKEVTPRLASRFFADEENCYLNGLAEEERNGEMIRIWTMKESYVKMTGEGIQFPFTDFSVISKGQNMLLRKGKKEECYFWTDEYMGYKMSVCAREQERKTGYTVISLK